MKRQKIQEVTAGLVAGKERYIAQVFSALQDHPKNLQSLMAEIYHQLETQKRRSFTVGITGPPGAGKSSLMKGVLKSLADEPVGVLMVDPSSPFSGGALLGDRLRIEGEISPKHFVRSLSSKGRQGGLCPAIRDLVRILTLAGKTMVWVETVGVGQNEIDVMTVADMTCVVITPDSGDVVQTMKAGLLEVADCFVINKADLPGAEQMKANLEGLQRHGVSIPVFLTTATRGLGIDPWVRHIRDCQRQGFSSLSRKNPDPFIELRERLLEAFEQGLKTSMRGAGWKAIAKNLKAGKTNPYSWMNQEGLPMIRRIFSKKNLFRK